MADIVEVLRELGFSQPRNVEGLNSIRSLWSSRTGGLYVLHFSDGSYYVGRSVHVVRRFAEHRRDKPDVVQISFRLTARAKQIGEEEVIIRLLNEAGFKLRNRVGMPSIEMLGPERFAEVMDQAQQEYWLENVDYIDQYGDRSIDPADRTYSQETLRAFFETPGVADVVEVARRYVQSCIPAYRRSEQYFWNVSAFPPGHEVMLRINVGKQETFAVASNGHGGYHYHWFLNRNLLQMVVGSALADLQSLNGCYWLSLGGEEGVEFEWLKSSLISGGDDQVELILFSAKEALRLLEDDLMIAASREFALKLVRSSRNPYRKSHRIAVADLLLEP